MPNIIDSSTSKRGRNNSFGCEAHRPPASTRYLSLLKSYSAEKYLLALLRTFCALISWGTAMWWTMWGRYIVSTRGVLFCVIGSLISAHAHLFVYIV